MEIITDLSQLSGQCNKSIATIGNFDGLHRGHQELVKKVINRAIEEDGKSVVFTFDPHPLKVLAPEKCPSLINISEEKIGLFREMGIELLIVVPFTKKIASKKAEDFVIHILIELLNIKAIFVGKNYRYGKDRKGNIQTLMEMGRTFGFDVIVVDYVAINSEIVSSTKIRHLLKSGEVEHAAKLLGRNYKIKGSVVKGDKRGRILGFPTANIEPVHEIIPAPGVYAVQIEVNGLNYSGITNIGYRPTFDKNTFNIETHIFDFHKNIYGQDLYMYFIRKLREEKKFRTVDSLVQQIEIDIEKAKMIFQTENFISTSRDRM